MKTMALHNVVFLRTEFVEFLAPSALVLLLMVPFSRLTEQQTCTLIGPTLKYKTSVSWADNIDNPQKQYTVYC